MKTNDRCAACGGTGLRQYRQTYRFSAATVYLDPERVVNDQDADEAGPVTGPADEPFREGRYVAACDVCTNLDYSEADRFCLCLVLDANGGER